MNDLEYRVENGDTLVVTYDMRAEDETDSDPVIYEFRMKMPEEDKILLQDALFVESMEAVFLHLVASMPFNQQSEDYLQELLELTQMRQQLYDKTMELIDQAERKDEAKPAVPVRKSPLYNNMVLDLIYG